MLSSSSSSSAAASAAKYHDVAQLRVVIIIIIAIIIIIIFIRVLSMSHPIVLGAPGYAEHRLSKHLCLVSQCQPGHIESLVCHRWAETHPYTWGRCSSRWPPVDQWCRCTSCGSTAFIVNTRWSCCQHPCSREHRDSCLISLGHQGQHRTPWTWSPSCWCRALYFQCQPSMLLAWRYNPPGCL